MRPIPQLVKNFFDLLETGKVQYCLWKSNEHLYDGLIGETDLDILVNTAHEKQCEQILLQLHFKKVESQKWCTYPGIEDWLGFDEETGKIFHIHLHYRLLIGRKYVKEVHFPFEKEVLHRAFRESEYGIRIIDPSLEVILLILRMGLKIPGIKMAMGREGSGLVPDDMLVEFFYLKERLSEKALKAYSEMLLGKPACDEINRIIMNGNLESPLPIRRLHNTLRAIQTKYNRLSRFAVWRVYITRRLIHIYSNLKKKITPSLKSGKTLGNGGIIIAVVGCDGSGKSSVVLALKKWLSWKNDVGCLYMGSGDGEVGFFTGLKKKKDGLVTEIKRNRQIQGVVSRNKSTLRHSFNTLIQSFFNVALARERYEKIRKAYKMRTKGRIILTDRYPQNEFRGIYDGPKVPVQDNPKSFMNMLEKKESRFYNRISKLPPDLVIKLNIPLEISRLRKPDEDLEIVRKKIEITPKLQYHGAKIVDLDASGPFDRVILDVKRAVWNNL
ncbi:hypothetical protein ACFL4N_00325 [Thermodesulfobacteriota bacterium]